MKASEIKKHCILTLQTCVDQLEFVDIITKILPHLNQALSKFQLVSEGENSELISVGLNARLRRRSSIERILGLTLTIESLKSVSKVDVFGFTSPQVEGFMYTSDEKLVGLIGYLKEVRGVGVTSI